MQEIAESLQDLGGEGPAPITAEMPPVAETSGQAETNNEAEGDEEDDESDSDDEDEGGKSKVRYFNQVH